MKILRIVSLKDFSKKIIDKIKENPFDYFLGAVFVIFLGIVLFQRYILGWTDWQPWTGIGSYVVEDEKVIKGKTLWDLMELLLIPLGGAYIAFRFSKTLKKNEQKIAEQRAKSEQELSKDRQREDALQSYFNQISELLLRKDGDLKVSKPKDEIRVVARTRTLSTLRMLDGTRKGQLLQFLKEANLIERDNSIVSLENADLTNMQMNYGNLSNIELVKVKLSNSKLYGTNLSNSNLQKSDFWSSSLINVIFDNSNLEGALFVDAVLDGAFFNSSHMKRCILTGASLGLITMNNTNLERADLTNAKLYWVSIGEVNFRNVNFKDAKMPDGKIYDPEIHTLEKLTA